jgi:3-phosphoshikimate 1-carboxyvinyltransferase
MKASIEKSSIKGSVGAPGSKSYTIRGLMCAALAEGESRIINTLVADDTEAAVEVLGQIGVSVIKEKTYWRVKGGSFHRPRADLFCRDSAATLRFMTAIASLVPSRCRLTAGQSLAKRPIEPLLSALAQLGVKCSIEGKSVVVDGGHLVGGTVEMPGDMSSQFVSALLLVAPLAKKGIEIILTTPPRSKPYLEMTLDCMQQFGIEIEVSEDFSGFKVSPQKYRAADYTVEGDWSSASYLLALGAACGEVTVGNLKLNSLQGDRRMLNLLQQMGVDIETKEDSVTVFKSNLRAITADLSNSIDLLPTMATLAALAKGESRFKGISRARIKESNRVLAVKEGLEQMDVNVVEDEDSLVIKGGSPTGALIDSFNDHRIAMAFSVLGMAVGDMAINGGECVAKTYPAFWQTFKNLGGEVKLDV